MKNLISALTCFFLISFTPVTNWKFDNAHSNLGFSIGHLKISEVKGTFKMKDATFVSQGDDFTDAAFTAEIDVASIDTDNDKRDDHMRTADFFDTAKFPTAKFKSTSCKKSNGEKYILSGDFEMHGITKPATFDLTVKTGISPINNKPIAGIKVTGIIKRSDFGISPTTPPEIITDEVAIEANLEFSKE